MSIAFPRALFVPLAAGAIIVFQEGHPAAGANPVAAPFVGSGVSGPARPATGTATPVRIYRAVCLKCHDSDGKGEIVRDVMPKVPDFTDAAWQSSRSDAELGRSILDGKGKSMPAMRDKIAPINVGQMVAFVRAFRDGKQVVEESEEPSSPEPAATVRPVNPAPIAAAPANPAAREPGFREESRVFQRSCAACHGSDGRGNEMRDTFSSIPDFTAGPWQQSRTDPQLLVSVLDGKGTGMPPFRDKLTREQVRNLVAYVRSFDPSPRPAVPSTSDDFEARFQRLVDEFDGLSRQIRALSPEAAPPQGSASGAGGRPSGAGRDGAQPSGAGKPGSGG